MRKTRCALLIAGALTLMACGGGGGGGEPDLVQISAANQDAVARITAIAIRDALGEPITGATATASKSAAQAGAASEAASLPGASALALQAVRSLLTPSSSVADGVKQSLSVKTPSDVFSCTYGGTVDETFLDRDNNGYPSAGDRLTWTYYQCQDVVGVIINGIEIFDISSVTATSFEGLITYQNLSTVIDTSSITLNGTASASYAQTQTPDGTSESMTLVFQTAGTTSVSLPGYSDTLTYYPGYTTHSLWFVPFSGSSIAEYATANLQGTIGSAWLGGRMALSVTPPDDFVELASEEFPHSGRAYATGKGSSALRFTAINAMQVQLDLDANGDGTFEASKLTDWLTLLP